MQITEVKKSKRKENIEHINSIKLKDKQNVYTEAHFVRIITGQDNNKISLKIGRYSKPKNFQNNILESKNPKSELTLDNEELDNLVKYINKHYYPLSNNENKYLALDENKMSMLVREHPETLSQLINIALTNEIDLSDVYKLINISNRRKALQKFLYNYNNNVTENVWQKWFENNSWVLGTDFVRISEDRSIDTKHITDFIAENIDGFIDIIEIKRVSDSQIFFEKIEDHGNLVISTTLNKAITQLANYLLSLEKRTNDQDANERLGNILKPRGILIYGCSKDWTKKEYSAYRLLNSTLNNITIYTYDMIYKRATKINDYLSK